MSSVDIDALAAAVLETCRTAGLMVATAESCTGGLIAGALTEVAGSSDVVERGFVTYSNEAKQELLGVPTGLLAREGAVNKEGARAMAEGAVERSEAQMAVSVTGIAGPGGGTDTKSVGLVYMAIARKGRKTVHFRDVFPGNRSEVRAATVMAALQRLVVAARSACRKRRLQPPAPPQASGMRHNPAPARL